MYREILCAIDFSEPGNEAAAWAGRRFPEARFTLFNAIEPLELPGYLREALGDELDLQEERELDVRSNLEHLAGELGLEQVRVDVRKGWAPEQAAKAAAESGADLMVLGAHTRRVLPWDEPGATAEAMVREVDIPVLVWRRTPSDGEPTVLAPVALRDDSTAVAETASRMAELVGGRLVLLHVLSGAFQTSIRRVSSHARARSAMRKVEASAREEALRRVPPELRSKLEIQTVVERGRPITQVLAVAEREAADLVVMGRSHAPGAAGRALLGSLTAKVIRGANCSVLSIPT